MTRENEPFSDVRVAHDADANGRFDVLVAAIVGEKSHQRASADALEIETTVQ